MKKKVLLILFSLFSLLQTQATELITGFEWLEASNTIEIAVGESYQLKYTSTTYTSLIFTSEYSSSWSHYDFSPSQHVVDSPTGYSISESGVITGLVVGSYAIKNTGNIISKGTKDFFYINVVAEHKESESNNTLDTADPFTQKIRFSLSNIADIDYFKYEHGLSSGKYVTFKVHYIGSNSAPYGYKWATYSGSTPSQVGSGSLIEQDQLCKCLVTSGDYCYFEVYYNQSLSSYFNYGEEFTVEVVDGSTTTISVTGISLNTTSTSLIVGGSTQLTATVSPSNATNTSVTWSSSNTTVATVSSSGLVNAKAAGTTTITSKAADGSGVTASCSVTVKSAEEERKNVVSSNTSGAKVAFSTDGAYEWEWDSSNSRLRSTNNGINSSSSLSTMTITTTQPTLLSFNYAVSSESNYDKLTIALDGNTIVNGISGSQSSTYSTNITSGTHTLVMIYVKDSSTDSNDDRAYISNLQLDVNLVTSITLSQTAYNMMVGDTYTLTATITPSDAANTNVNWSSSNKSVVSVNTEGIITANGAGTAVITCEATDGSGVKATCQVTVEEETTILMGDFDGDGKITAVDIATLTSMALGKMPAKKMTLDNCLDALKFTGSVTQNGETKSYTYHEYVDLGLPSGTLWATCNVGADSPEDYGDYFAWGETTGYDSGKTSFSWSTYKYCNGSSSTQTKYCTSSSCGTVDDKTELEAADDAATANWGSEWRMPFYDQIKELFNSSFTTTTWTTENGMYGRKITSNTNGNSIFLPAAGCRVGSSLYDVGSDGDYWSCSLYTSYSCDAHFLNFDSSGIGWGDGSRCGGRSVRPVRSTSK